MANVNSVSSNSNSTSSLYGSRNVLSGLASGLDTETMIENAVSGYQTKITSLQQDQEKLEWTQSAYRTLADEAVSFANKYTSYGGSNALGNASYYIENRTTDVTGPNADKLAVTADKQIKDPVYIKEAVTATKASLLFSDGDNSIFDKAISGSAETGYTLGKNADGSNMTVADLVGAGNSLTISVGGADLPAFDAGTSVLDVIQTAANAEGLSVNFSSVTGKLTFMTTGTGSSATIDITTSGKVTDVDTTQTIGGILGQSGTIQVSTADGRKLTTISSTDTLFDAVKEIVEKNNADSGKVFTMQQPTTTDTSAALSATDYGVGEYWAGTPTLSFTVNGADVTMTYKDFLTYTAKAANDKTEASFAEELEKKQTEYADAIAADRDTLLEYNHLMDLKSSFARDYAAYKAEEWSLDDYSDKVPEPTEPQKRDFLNDVEYESAKAVWDSDATLRRLFDNNEDAYKYHEGSAWYDGAGYRAALAAYQNSSYGSAEAKQAWKDANPDMFDRTVTKFIVLNPQYADFAGVDSSGTDADAVADDVDAFAEKLLDRTSFSTNENILYTKDDTGVVTVKSSTDIEDKAKAEAKTKTTQYTPADTNAVTVTDVLEAAGITGWKGGAVMTQGKDGTLSYNIGTVYNTDTAKSLVDKLMAADDTDAVPYTLVADAFTFQTVDGDNELTNSGKIKYTAPEVVTDSTKTPATSKKYKYGETQLNIGGELMTLTDLYRRVADTIQAGNPLDSNGNLKYSAAGRDDTITVVIDGKEATYTGTKAGGTETISQNGAAVDASKKITYQDGAFHFEALGLNVKVNGDFTASSTEEQAAVSTKLSTERQVDAVKSFVSDLNSLLTNLRTAYSTAPLKDSSGKAYSPLTDKDKSTMSESAIDKYEKDAKTGLLYGDSTLRSFYNQILSSFTNIGSSTGDHAEMLKKLNNLGITQKYESGQTTLELDEEKLRNSLKLNENAVKEVFVGESKEVTVNGKTTTASSGLMYGIKNVMEGYASTSTGKMGLLVKKAGTTSSASSQLSNEMKTQLDRLAEQIKSWQDKMSSKVDYYTRQFSLLETLMNKFNSQSSMLSGLMGGG